MIAMTACALALALGFESHANDLLPEGAVGYDDNGAMQLYLSPDEGESGSSEWSIWLKDNVSGEVTFVLTTNSDIEPRWEDMTDGNAIPVPPNMIAVGDVITCAFVPWDANLIFIEGCPDGRNIWSYVININEGSAMQFPTNEGLFTFDVDGERYHMCNYNYYPDGGRYSMERIYNADGTFTGQESELEY